MTSQFPFYTIAEAAEIIGVTHSRLRQMLRAGIMKGHKAGERAWLIPKKEVARIKAIPQSTGRPRVSQR